MLKLEVHRRRPRRRDLLTAVAVALVTLSAGSAQATPLPLPPPADLAVAPGPITAASQVTATWTVPPGLPAGTTAQWTLCPVLPDAPEEGDCRSGDVAEGETSATVAFPQEGAFDLTVRLRGSEDGPASSPLRIMIDRTAPTAPVDFRWEYDVARWVNPEDGGSPIVRVHWELCRGWMGYARQCLVGAGPAEPFALSVGMIALGPPPAYCLGADWMATLWLEDAAGNLDRRNVASSGGAVSPACIPPPGDPNDNPKADPPTTSTPRATTRLALGGRLTATGKGSKRRKVLLVTATAKPGEAGGTVRLRVTGKQGKRTLSRTRNVRLANGRASFTLTVPKGFRQLKVKATYAGSKTHAPSSRTMTVRIP